MRGVEPCLAGGNALGVRLRELLVAPAEAAQHSNLSVKIRCASLDQYANRLPKSLGSASRMPAVESHAEGCDQPKFEGWLWFLAAYVFQ